MAIECKDEKEKENNSGAGGIDASSRSRVEEQLSKSNNKMCGEDVSVAPVGRSCENRNGDEIGGDFICGDDDDASLRLLRRKSQ